MPFSANALVARTLIFQKRIRLRRSWHLFRVVSSAGCPGVIGPFPQPVSMSYGRVYGRNGIASTEFIHVATT